MIPIWISLNLQQNFINFYLFYQTFCSDSRISNFFNSSCSNKTFLKPFIAIESWKILSFIFLTAASCPKRDFYTPLPSLPHSPPLKMHNRLLYFTNARGSRRKQAEAGRSRRKQGEAGGSRRKQAEVCVKKLKLFKIIIK